MLSRYLQNYLLFTRNMHAIPRMQSNTRQIFSNFLGTSFVRIYFIHHFFLFVHSPLSVLQNIKIHNSVFAPSFLLVCSTICYILPYLLTQELDQRFSANHIGLIVCLELKIYIFPRKNKNIFYFPSMYHAFSRGSRSGLSINSSPFYV